MRLKQRVGRVVDWEIAVLLHVAVGTTCVRVAVLYTTCLSEGEQYWCIVLGREGRVYVQRAFLWISRLHTEYDRLGTECFGSKKVVVSGRL